MFKHGFPPEWSTFKKLIWLVGSGIAGAASGIWKTVTGSLIHITDALASPMQKCEVTLEPIQDLHGQDAPYPAGGGKNRFQTTATTQTINDKVFTVNSDGSITLSGTASAAVGNFIVGEVVLPAGTYKVNGLAGGGGSSVRFTVANVSVSPVTILATIYSGRDLPFTLESESTVRITIIVPNGNSDALTIYPMIRLSSVTDDTFAPYSNICPITGWTGCEVTVDGANLYPYTTIPSYNYAWYSGSKALADATNPVFLKGGKKYAVSADQSVAATTSAIVRAWRADGTILENAQNVLNLKDPVSGTTATYQAAPKYYQLSTSNYAKPFTNTIEPTEDLWVDMRCSGNNRVGNDPMLQVGDSRTTYEPYNGTTLSVTFPDSAGTVYGGTVDLVSGDGANNRAKTLFSDIPSNYFSLAASNALRITNPSQVLLAFPNIKLPATNYDVANVMCNIGKAVGASPISYKDQYNACFAFASGGAFYLVDTSCSTVEEYRTKYADAVFVYEVAEPTEISLTPQPISTLAGENNVWGDGDSVKITYKAQA